MECSFLFYPFILIHLQLFDDFVHEQSFASLQRHCFRPLTIFHLIHLSDNDGGCIQNA